MDYRIPFNKPFVAGQELYYVAQAVASGQISGAGAFSRKCEELLEARTGAARVLLTTSGTAALEMAAILSGVGPGDEFIAPAYTFSSTANAFMLRGARPRFVDIRPDTLNLDHDLVEAAITANTRVIVPVHYAGVACDMDAIGATARRHGLTVVEDAAQGVNAKYKGRYEGTLGDLGAYSFHESKNFICGEGGALALSDPALAARAEEVREDGTDRRRLFRGEVDAYSWVGPGGAFILPDLLAAFLYAQLEHLDEITAARRTAWERYRDGLEPLAARGLVTLPRCPGECEQNYHMFYLLLGDEQRRDALIERLRGAGVLAVFHYVPLHTSPMGERLGYRKGMLPVTEALAARLLRLPLFHETREVMGGDAGALLVGAPEHVERAEIIREKGTDRARFFRGEVEKYTWVDIGSSYVPSDLAAAFLCAQLERLDDIVARRIAICAHYREALAGLAGRGLLALPAVAPDAEPAHHGFFVLVGDAPARAALIEHLARHGIMAVRHFSPLHSSAMGRRLGYAEGMLPVTEDIARRVLRLPFYHELEEREIEHVVAQVQAFFGPNG